MGQMQGSMTASAKERRAENEIKDFIMEIRGWGWGIVTITLLTLLQFFYIHSYLHTHYLESLRQNRLVGQIDVIDAFEASTHRVIEIRRRTRGRCLPLIHG